MERYSYAYAIGVLLAFLIVSGGGGEASSVWAGRKPPMRSDGTLADLEASAQPKFRQSELIRKSAEPSPKQRAGKKRAIKGEGTPSRGKAARRGQRHSKAGKPLRPQATIAPKPDLSYHGILEQPQRYAPQYERSKGGVPNPNTRVLLHDHFQELDRNRDGTIDPFERALGRLDMDHDLADRQRQ